MDVGQHRLMIGQPYGVGNTRSLFTFLLFTVMKKISTSFAVFCALALLAAPRAPRAQTITLDSLSGTTFCSGDQLSATFTATGTWGHKNAFTLQLSNDSGTFDNGFQNIGSIDDTAPGTFTIYSAVPTNISSRPMSISMHIITDSGLVRDTTFDTTSATHYRFRVIGANPYEVSSDNGSDITFNKLPNTLSMNVPISMTGTNTTLALGTGGLDSADLSDSVFWDFGTDASPATAIGTLATDAAETTIYSTAGQQTVQVRIQNSTGCSITESSSFAILSCDPQIPPTAQIDSDGHDFNDVGASLWVNPGVNVSFHGVRDTIYVESGATIVSSGTESVLYLKPGAAYVNNGGVHNILVVADGVSLSLKLGNDETIVVCSDLGFDYSQAPPNAIMAAYESVAPTVASELIGIYPNPTNGILTLENIPMGANVMVMNVLGETVQTENAHGNTNLSLDLSNVIAGTYYIRIASGNNVTTKSIVKE